MPREPPLIPPYGGSLVELMVPSGERGALLRHAARLPSVRLSPRAICDLELLATGAFSPLLGSHLSKGLGFGKEDRDTNVRRIAFVAAVVARSAARTAGSRA